LSIQRLPEDWLIDERVRHHVPRTIQLGRLVEQLLLLLHQRAQYSEHTATLLRVVEVDEANVHGWARGATTHVQSGHVRWQ